MNRLKKPVNIWLISSDSNIYKDTYTVLKKKAYKVRKFTNSTKVPAYLRKQTPDVLLVDFQLSPLNGARLTWAIKSDNSYKEIPVILIADSDFSASGVSKADIVLTKTTIENLNLKIITAITSIINSQVFPSKLWKGGKKDQKISREISSDLFSAFSKFDAIFDNNILGIMELDKDSMIISANLKAQNLLSIPIIELIGSSIDSIHPKWNVLLKSDISQPIILEYSDKLFEVTLLEVGESRSETRKLLIFNDITEKSRLDAELQRYTSDLETEVEKRILEIKLTNIELEKLNQLKSEYLSNVSHEMRTPLATIKGFAETLINRTINEDERSEFLGIILSESNRLERIVNDILDITKIQQGILAKSLHFEKIDPIIEANYVVKLLTVLAEEKKIKIGLKASKDSYALKADKERFRQILINLVENAIKFSPESSSITIDINKKKEDLFINISDQGPGIPVGEQKKIFEKFYMIDGSDSKTRRGTGIGLFIASMIVTEHSGQIYVESKYKKGSKFVIRLPLDK